MNGKALGIWQLQRLCELFRKYLRLFRQVFRARPVAVFYRGSRFFQEGIHFGREIRLRCAELVALRARQVSLRNSDAFVHLLLGGCNFLL